MAEDKPTTDTVRNQAVVASDHPAYRPTDPDVDSAGVRRATGKLMQDFLKSSGYRAADVIGSNEATRTFVTSNGGKYVLSPRGTKIRTLSGPLTPSELKEEESGGDEEE